MSEAPLNAIEYRNKNYSLWMAGFYAHVLTSARWKELAQFFCNETNKQTNIKSYDDISYLVNKLFFGVALNEHLQSLIAQAIRDYTSQRLHLPSYGKILDPNWQKCLKDLEENGFTRLPKLPKEIVKEMRDYFLKQPVEETMGGPTTSISKHNRDHLAQYDARTILKCPHFLEIASDPKILTLVENYLGALPTNNVVSAWWSFAERSKARDAQLFHLDHDDVRFCKLFIYLTDVDSDNGPHIFLPGTHRPSLILKKANSWGGDPNEFIQWHLHKLRKTDEEVKKYFGTEAVELLGEAGSCFLVNTFGIHKGKLPNNGERLLCQTLYGLSQILQPTIEPVSAQDLKNGTLPPKLYQQPFAYTHRLFVHSEQTPKINYQYW